MFETQGFHIIVFLKCYECTCTQTNVVCHCGLSTGAILRPCYVVLWLYLGQFTLDTFLMRFIDGCETCVTHGSYASILTSIQSIPAASLAGKMQALV